MDQIALHIIGLALCIIVLAEAAYLVSISRREPLGLWLNPYLFIPIWGCSSIVLTFLIDIERAFTAIALAGGVLLGLAHPAVSVSFFIACFLLRPWEFGPPNDFLQMLPRLLAATTLLSWTLYRLRKQDWKIVWNYFNYLLLSLTVWLALAAGLSYNPEESLAVLVTSFLPILVSSFMIVNSVNNKAALRLIFGTLVISVASIQVIALYHTFLSDAEVVERLEGIGRWANSNDLASLIVIAAPLTLAPLFKGRFSFTRLLLKLPLLLVLFGSLWLSQSRGAMLALGGAVMLLLFINRAKIGSVRLTLILMPLLMLASVFYFGIRREASDLEISTGARFNYAITGFRMVLSSPIFGVGPGNYENLYEQYTTSFDEWGKRTAHSSWVLVMSEGGLPALLLFLSLFFLVFKFAWRIRFEYPELLLSLVGYAVAISFLSHTYFLPPYILFSLIVAARALHLDDLAREEEPAEEQEYFSQAPFLVARGQLK